MKVLLFVIFGMEKEDIKISKRFVSTVKLIQAQLTTIWTLHRVTVFQNLCKFVTRS